jgi:hypothetical protein
MPRHAWHRLRVVETAGARCTHALIRSRFIVPCIALLVLCLATVAARAAESVGVVTNVANQVTVGGQTAAVGTVVHMNDTLRTGAKARLQVSFRDKSELTLGENATVIVDKFVFDPEASVGESALRATRGAFRFATGRIGSMGQKRITVQTPVAALAVRGTDFWGGVIDGQYGVLLMSNSALSVRNRECDELLTKANWGVDLPLRRDDDDECSGAYEWPPDKIARALSQTNFNVLNLNPGILAPAIPAIIIPGVITDDDEPEPTSP